MAELVQKRYEEAVKMAEKARQDAEKADKKKKRKKDN
jgi:hypothetical protein